MHDALTITLPGGETVPAIQLQGIGWVRAKPARDFKPGDVTRWNYAFDKAKDGCLVVSVEARGRTQVTMKLTHRGKEYSRNLKADRLVGYFA